MKLFNFDSPETWDDLVALKPKLPYSIPETCRFPEDLEFYKLYVKLIPKEIRVEIVKSLIGDNQIKLLQNNFPYLKLIQHINGVKHYCLWSQIGKLSKNTVESEILKNFPNKPYFWFENSSYTKSMPEIWHCHIFVQEN